MTEVISGRSALISSKMCIRDSFYPGENGYAEVRLDNGDRVFIGSNRGGVSREHPLELTRCV